MLSRALLVLMLLFCGEANATQFHAVLVGINDYDSPYSDLGRCISSASGFKRSLIDSLGWNSSNIDTLVDAAATKNYS